MKILVCICGGIAAYKSADLVNQLYKDGHEVKVMMTENACKFITPLTLQTLSKQSVITDTFNEEDPTKINHIYYAQEYDMIVVAPMTANMIGKVANGIADDVVSSTLIAANIPIILVPAMNTVMYENRINQANLDKLKNYGYTIIEPDSGLLACGVEGKGKFPTIDKIINEINILTNVVIELNKRKNL